MIRIGMMMTNLHLQLQLAVGKIQDDDNIFQSRDSFLVEYTGEGSARSSDPECGDQLMNDLPNLAECSSQFGCKCQVLTRFEQMQN